MTTTEAATKVRLLSIAWEDAMNRADYEKARRLSEDLTSAAIDCRFAMLKVINEGAQKK